MTSRRRRNDPPKLELTREPGLRIAGRDADREPWVGIDAIRTNIVCVMCGERFQYGYVPLWETIGHTPRRAHCVKCVVFVDAERSGR